MITDRVLSVVLSPIYWLLGAFPDVSWPLWFAASGSGSVAERAAVWGSSVGLLGGWFPVAEFFDAGSLVLVCIGVAVAIKLVRIVVSLLTAGGGSAA